jgi:uncharacterized protein YjbI with pentapeptide repeats
MPPQQNQPPGKRPTRVQKLCSLMASPFRWGESRVIEPFANTLDSADIFRIIEKLSPVIEAIGIIAIPLVIWWATQSAQEAKDKAEKEARAQEAVKTYLNQLSAVFLDGNLEKDERLRVVTRASTLALLNDPNLDGDRKGQVVEYLTELKLVQVEKVDVGKGDVKPLISLASSNLRGADLSDTDIRGEKRREAVFREGKVSLAEINVAYLFGLDIFGANLRGADLRMADLSGANLSGAYLGGANLSRADLRGADIFGTDLRGADLRGANLSAANLSGANLSGANLSEEDLSRAKLCKTILPSSVKLNLNRDCKELKITP